MGSGEPGALRERNVEAQRAFAAHVTECQRCTRAEIGRWQRRALCFTGAWLKSEALAARRALVSARPREE